MLDQDSERRVYPRFAAPKGTIVAWHRFNKRAVSAVDNLGLGGLFIRTPDPPPAGTFIQLRLQVRYALVPLSNEVAPNKAWA
jgi:hypothetical protein